MNESDIQKVFVIDDDKSDLEIIERFFKKSRKNVDLFLFSDGAEALNQIYSGLIPKIIFLDINMPSKSGKEILEEIRKNRVGSRMIVIMLSGSERESDILECYDLGANSYLVKPYDLKSLYQQLEVTCSYWLDVSRLPSYTPRDF